MRLKIGLLVSVLAFFATSLFAFQDEVIPFRWEDLPGKYTVRHLTVDDGLPINSINRMVHHTDGFIYFATNDGLVKFDGQDYEIFNTSKYPVLNSNRFNWVGSGANNELWFRDIENHLYQLDKTEIKKLQDISAFEDLDVLKIEKLNSEAVLLTTNQGFYVQNGPFSFKQYPFSFKQYPFIETQKFIDNSFVISENRILFFIDEGALIIDNESLQKLISSTDLKIDVTTIFDQYTTADGHIWILTDDGKLLEIESNYEQHLYEDPQFSGIEFRDLIELDQNVLLINSSIGYISFDRGTNSFELTEYTSEMEEYHVNDLWDQGEFNQIYSLNDELFIEGNSVFKASKNINQITRDTEGSLWVPTNGDGVYQLVEQRIITIDDEIINGLSNVYGMAERGDEIWITSFENGVFSISNSEIKNWNSTSEDEQMVYMRSVASETVLYAGSFFLFRFVDNRWVLDETLGEVSDLIDVIYFDNNDNFYVGTGRQLFIKEKENFKEFRDEKGEVIDGVNFLKSYFNQEIIAGTHNKGVAILGANRSVMYIDESKGLGSNTIRDVWVSSKDTLWVVTEDQGLNRVVLSESKEIKGVIKITVSDGLIDNSLHRMIRDDFGFFWINSNKGIMRIAENDLNKYADGAITFLPIYIFDKSNGLKNVEGNGGTQNAGLLTEDGKLFFPNQPGLIYTKPEWHIDITSELRKPIFEWVAFNDSSIVPHSDYEVTLPKTARDLQVKFTVPTFSQPNKLTFRYKVPGVVDTWQFAGVERLARLTNLPAGNLQLIVEAQLADSREVTTSMLTLNIEPKFYETKAFILLIGITIVLLFVGGFRLLLVQAQRREKYLNKIVTERTKELTEEKKRTEEALIQVKKLDESKTQFFTKITHELRTPLSLILSPLNEMISGDAKSLDKKNQNLDLIHRNAVRLKDLVGQLLNISKLNAGELELDPEPIDIVSYTQSIIAQFEHRIEYKKIRFHIDSDSLNQHHLNIDKNAWGHICTNLVGNALKFTPKKGAITIRFSEDDHSYYCDFSDTGEGIKKRDLPFIFDSYYQGESSLSKAEGTGIGLAMVKGLIDLMNGSIHVDSSPSGTTFRIAMRKELHQVEEWINTTKEADSKELENPSVIFQTNQGTPNSSHRANVMLVEDNDDMRTYLQSVISGMFDVKAAENGLEALKLLDDFIPDIIVSDIMMPEIDGYEMVKKIRSLDRFAHIPVIFISAKDSVAEIEYGLNAGADIYLPKPFENSLLITQINALLRREKALLESTSHTSEQLSELEVQVIEIIKRHLGNPDLSVDMIAIALSMSSPTLYRKWRNVSDESINSTILQYRFVEALELIQKDGLSISEASYAVGFSNLAYFSKAFKKKYGYSPKHYLEMNETASEY
ncbi:MAG: response regulator [Balneolaceae bacterium]|nr:response regulator [Balneolaceae bacterium]